MIAFMMEKEEHTRSCEEMHATSSVVSQLSDAHEDTNLWKELQKAFNIVT